MKNLEKRSNDFFFWIFLIIIFFCMISCDQENEPIQFMPDFEEAPILDDCTPGLIGILEYIEPWHNISHCFFEIIEDPEIQYNCGFSFLEAPGFVANEVQLVPYLVHNVGTAKWKVIRIDTLEGDKAYYVLQQEREYFQGEKNIHWVCDQFNEFDYGYTRFYGNVDCWAKDDEFGLYTNNN